MQRLPNSRSVSPNSRLLRHLSLPAAVLVPVIASAGLRYSQDFDRFENGATDLRDGSTISSNDGTTSVHDGALRLTTLSVGSTHSAYHLPRAGAAATRGFEVRFDFLVDAGGDAPADGFAFSYGALPSDTERALSNGAGEEGFGVGLSVEVDTRENLSESAGYNVAIDDVDVPGGAIRQPPPVDGAWHRARIVWIAGGDGGRVTFSIDDEVIFDDLPTPGFQPTPRDHFAFSARTGAGTETLLIDNVALARPSRSEERTRRRCVAAKLAVLRKYTVDLLRCHAKSLISDPTPDTEAELDECVALRTERFSAAWRRIEARGGCPDGLSESGLGDRARSAARIFANLSRNAIRGTDAGPSRAKLVKLGAKHASKHYASLIRYARRPNRARRDAKIAADRRKFDARVERLAAKAERAELTVVDSTIEFVADRLEDDGQDIADLVDFEVIRRIRSGLVAYWSFDSSGPTVVDHVGGPADFHGEMQGHASRVDGLFGSAMRFDGDRDAVRVATASALDTLKNTSEMTISAWIRPNGPGSDSTEGGIIVSKEGEFQLARFADGTIRAAVALPDGQWDWFGIIDNPPVAPVGEWSHVLFDFGNGFSRARLNDEHIYGAFWTAGARGDHDPSEDELWIGDRQGRQQSFDGEIDDVAIWNRILTTLERQAIFNEGRGKQILRTRVPSEPTENDD